MVGHGPIDILYLYVDFKQVLRFKKINKNDKKSFAPLTVHNRLTNYELENIGLDGWENIDLYFISIFVSFSFRITFGVLHDYYNSILLSC